MKERWKLWVGAFLVGLVGMLAGYAGLSLVGTLYRDHLAIRAFDEFLGYNIQQGRLVRPSAPVSAPATAPPTK